MTRWPIAATLGLAGALAGCASYQELAHAECTSYGAQPGSDAYVACMSTTVASLYEQEADALGHLGTLNSSNAAAAAALNAPPVVTYGRPLYP